MNEQKEISKDAQNPKPGDEGRLRFALSATPMFVWEWELATNTVTPLHDQLGLWADSGGELFRWVHEDDLEQVRAASMRIVAGETLGAIDYRLVTPGGQERWCSFQARRRCGADGQPTHLCGVTLDITERMLAAAARNQAAELPSAEPSGAHRPLKILVLEDHPPTAKAIARLLRSHGHTIRVAHGLVTAERAVAAEQFDLLLCDLHLPEGSGLDFLPRIRHHLRRWAAGGAEAPAIVLSSFTQESDVARSLAAGYVAHLAKPVDQDELLAAIWRAMTRTAANEG